ncbi:MAG: hypothetical protein DMG54_10735 [Acidobacteria bacterium]|nr:MAG: hypothetical protein DMG54_10735 [Acidobacteriota bacterium]
MRTGKKTVLLLVLGFLEVVFLSWTFASNLPRRSADIDAFMRYQSAPTEENKELWLKERQKTQNEVTLMTSLGVCLAVGNGFLMGWVVRRRAKSPPGGDAPSSSDAPINVR